MTLLRRFGVELELLGDSHLRMSFGSLSAMLATVLFVSRLWCRSALMVFPCSLSLLLVTVDRFRHICGVLRLLLSFIDQ